MVKTKRTNPICHKIGIAFDAVLLEQLDEFAKRSPSVKFHEIGKDEHNGRSRVTRDCGFPTLI